MICRLAIAAPSLDWPSETFIRAHIQHLAPGRTALVCQHAPTVPPDAPLLTDMRRAPPKDTLAGKLWRYGMGARELITGTGLPPRDRARVAGFLRDYGVEVVLAEYGWVGSQLFGAARAAGARLYVHFHGNDATDLPRHWYWRRRYRQMFASAAGIIAPSRFIAERLRALGCPEDKLHVSPNGVDPEQFRPTSRQGGRVVAVGRLVEKKAPHLTLQAFARARDRVPDAHLDMIGDGDLRSRCKQLVRDLALTNAVTMHGVQSPHEIANSLAKASLFVQHSVTAANGDTEGLPLTILEAMAAGLPVVSTRHSGIPEAVVDGETGILVDEHDVDGMATALADLLSDEARAAAMGWAGRERVLAHFTHEHVRQRLLTVMDLDDPHLTNRAAASSAAT
jgi:glycosyltransferase involved in cell wall biosynthesis